EVLLEKIKGQVPEEQRQGRKHDVVHTELSKIAGRIEGATLRADTVQFGEVKMKLADVRTLRLASAKPPVQAFNAPPHPGHPRNFANQVGQVFYFTVTGANNGALWGTDVYTTDSSLAMAAAHVGAVKVGETGVVKVTIVVPPPNFQGSTRNGV